MASAALIVAIVFGALGLVFNKQILDGCAWVYRTYSWSSENYCYQLLWRDLFSHPDDEVHIHRWPDYYSGCNCSIQSHDHEKRCWEKTISRVLNRASNEASNFPEKPHYLWAGESYLRTQANVLLAYFICTVRCNNFDPAMLGLYTDYISLEQNQNFMLAHLGSPKKILNLTPREIQAILNGAPPFYRKNFSTPEGHQLTDRNYSKVIGMPGWIIAIGLGHLQPTDVFVSRSPEPYTTSIQVAANLLESWLPLFEGDQVRWAIDQLQVMVNGLDPLHSPGVVRDADTLYRPANLATNTIDYPPNQYPLTADQCNTLLDVFDTRHISESQADILRPAILFAMKRIVLGAAVATRYFRRYNREMIIPASLRGDNIIYLRDCNWGMRGRI